MGAKDAPVRSEGIHPCNDPTDTRSGNSTLSEEGVVNGMLRHPGALGHFEPTLDVLAAALAEAAVAPATGF